MKIYEILATDFDNYEPYEVRFGLFDEDHKDSAIAKIRGELPNLELLIAPIDWESFENKPGCLYILVREYLDPEELNKFDEKSIGYFKEEK